MKNTIILIITLLVAGLFVSAKAQTVKQLTTQQFKEQVWNFDTNKEWKYIGTKPAIIDLYANWCGPCKKLAPILEEIQKEYGSNLQVYKVDVDKETTLAQIFNASSIPLLIFIPKEGQPVAVAGLRPKEQLVQIITEQLKVKPAAR